MEYNFENTNPKSCAECTFSKYSDDIDICLVANSELPLSKSEVFDCENKKLCPLYNSKNKYDVIFAVLHSLNTKLNKLIENKQGFNLT